MWMCWWVIVDQCGSAVLRLMPHYLLCVTMAGVSRGAGELKRPRVSNAIIPASSLSSDLASERSSSRPNKDDAHRIRPDGSVACHTLVNWWVVALLNKLGDNWRDVACGAAGAGQYRWVCMTR